MDHRLVGGDIDAAVLLGGGEAKGVVILVDGASHGAEGVVAVGHGVGHGELFKPAGPGGLYDTHEGDVVGDQGVKGETELLRVRAPVVGAENGVGNGPLPGGGEGIGGLGTVGGDDLTASPVGAGVDDFYHSSGSS